MSYRRHVILKVWKRLAILKWDGNYTSSDLGKPNVRAACPKAKLEFNLFFSSPGIA